MNEKSSIAIATSSRVVRSSLKVALVVGSVLAAINHGQALLHLDFNPASLAQIALTYAVPYCVSTYSAVKAIQQS